MLCLLCVFPARVDASVCCCPPPSPCADFGVFQVSARYPVVEWGVLLRPDKEATPRYASPGWLLRLKEAAAAVPGMQLAGHLCGERVNQVLGGDVSFVKEMVDVGFRRFQVNATAANGVDTSRLADNVDGLRAAIAAVPEAEFILQCNEETKPLWQALTSSSVPDNISLLFDASCGLGVEIDTTALPSAPTYTTADGAERQVRCGFAGGIGPANVSKILTALPAHMGDTPTWIDMESSLRATLDGKDVFSIDKCFACLEAALPLITSVGARRGK